MSFESLLTTCQFQFDVFTILNINKLEKMSQFMIWEIFFKFSVIKYTVHASSN